MHRKISWQFVQNMASKHGKAGRLISSLVLLFLLTAAVTAALAGNPGVVSSSAATYSSARASGPVLGGDERVAIADPLPSREPEACKTYPYLQNVTQESMVIMWQTCSKEVSRARYRLQGEETWTEVSETKPVQIHELHFTDLDPEATYEYQVSLDGTGRRTPEVPANFRAAPGPWQAYRVAAYGDSRSNPERYTEVVSSILTNQPDIVFHTGDLTIQGRKHKYWAPQFFEPAADLMASTPMFPVLGNHDYRGPEQMWYFDMFSLPGNEEWYAFTYGCSRFIVVNSNADQEGVSLAPGSEQYTWLEDELQSPEAEAARWQFVLFHHPPFTSGSHLGKEQPTEKYLVPLFEQYGVDLVLSGHSHQYERSYKEGIYYIVTGGGGADLHDFPNVGLNPYSQVRRKEYHHVTLDINCIAGTVELNAWDREGERLDGPIVLEDGPVPALRLHLPLASK